MKIKTFPPWGFWHGIAAKWYLDPEDLLVTTQQQGGSCYQVESVLLGSLLGERQSIFRRNAARLEGTPQSALGVIIPYGL